MPLARVGRQRLRHSPARATRGRAASGVGSFSVERPPTLPPASTSSPRTESVPARRARGAGTRRSARHQRVRVGGEWRSCPAGSCSWSLRSCWAGDHYPSSVQPCIDRCRRVRHAAMIAGSTSGRLVLSSCSPRARLPRAPGRAASVYGASKGARSCPNRCTLMGVSIGCYACVVSPSPFGTTDNTGSVVHDRRVMSC